MNINHSDRLLYSILFSVALFFLYFSGDGVFIGSIPIIVVLYATVGFLLFFTRLEYAIYRGNILPLSLLICPILVASIWIDYKPDYFFWVINSIIGYIFLVQFQAFYESERLNQKLMATLFLAFFIIFFIGIHFLSTAADGRAKFIFGPNVLYRVQAITSLSLLLLFDFRNKLLKLSLVFIVSALYLACLIGIGSRGGVVVFLIMAIVFAHYYYGHLSIKNTFKKLVFAFSFIAVFVHFSPDSIKEIHPAIDRLTSFDIEDSESLKLRFSPMQDLFSDAILMEYPLGMMYEDFFTVYGQEGFKYPHNFVLELVFFFGFIGLVLSVFIIYRFSVAFFTVPKRKFDFTAYIAYSGMIILLASMFSGDLNDNFPILSIALFLAHKKVFNYEQKVL
ncbi:TPA: O-antigen ligase family protein [Vibrio metoecus]